MKLRIGASLDGEAVVFDTHGRDPFLIVGDTGVGKTTIARYIARWWRADTRRHLHVLAERPDQWTDLHAAALPTDARSTFREFAGTRTCLTVIDGAECLAPGTIEGLAQQSGPVLLTARGSLRAVEEVAVALSSIGLVGPESAMAAERSLLAGQGRLDWPAGAVSVVPDRRGVVDFPPHRWQMAASL